MSEKTTTPTSTIPAGELIRSLTGYEEEAIVAAYGGEIEDLEGSPFLRALVFVDQKRREGVSDKAALTKAKSLKRSELMSYFPEDEEEAMPDEPTTESGNG